MNGYNWSDDIGETTIADFEAATGVWVVYDLYASAEEAQARMLAGSAGHDVVLHSGMGMPRFIAAALYQKIDRARLPGWANPDPAILKIIDGFDPGNQYSVPYMWGSVGMTHAMDMVQKRLPGIDLNSLDAVMKPKNAAKPADCGISILDSPDDTGFLVFSWLGIDPGTAGPAEYARLVEAFNSTVCYSPK